RKVFPPSIERQNLEDVWRMKLEEASNRYKAANVCYRKKLEEQSKGLCNDEDASAALIGAQQEESQTLAEYLRILKMFTDLTVYGKIPREQQAGTRVGLREARLITVVDDDQSIRESMNTLLRSAGYQVQTFA